MALANAARHHVRPSRQPQEDRVSRIDIQRSHALTPEEVHAAIDEIAQSLTAKYGVRCAWQGGVLDFSRPGVEGSITVTTHEVHLRARLGLAMRPFKPVIEREIERYLDQRLA